MRRLALALLVLAAPAAAQTTDALIDRLVQRQHLGESAGIAYGAYPMGFEALDSTAVTDSLHAAFRRDARPDLLREALSYLDRPDAVRFERRARLQAPSDEVLTETFNGDAPKNETLADSLLARRYVRALGTDSFMVSFVRTSITQSGAWYATDGQEPEGPTSSDLGFMEAMIAGIELQIGPAARIELAGAAPSDVEAFILYAESPAGRYVRGTTLGVILAGSLRQMEERAKAVLESFQDVSLGSSDKPSGTP